MSLINERITIDPLEENLVNMPLELNALPGGGISVATQGSNWGPAAQETPQLAQSVDTEGAGLVTTTIGTRSSPVLKLGVIEPPDAAGTNWVLNPQCVDSGIGSTYSAVSTAVLTTRIVRDIIGYDYAIVAGCPGTNAGEGASAPVGTASSPSGSITAGVWIKGAAGGEAITLSLAAGGTAATLNATLTTAWQWFTVTSSTWSAASPTLTVVSQTATRMTFYATGWALVPGTSLATEFDGTSLGCAWTGLPHSSVSTRPAPNGPRMSAIMGDLEQAIKSLSLQGGTVRRTIPSLTGSTFRITYDVLNAQLAWDDMEYTAAGIAQCTITFTCEPYGRGPEMTTVTDSFNPLIPTDYVTDLGALTRFTWGATGLSAVSNLASENRFLNQVSEYPVYSGEVQASFTPGATLTNFKGGVILQRTDASNYLEGYITDNGTNSLLKIDKVVNGTRTNVALVTQGSRIVNGTAYTVRLRVQRQATTDNVYAEYFSGTSSPAATATPTSLVGPYVITDAIFGVAVPGLAGIVFTPQTAGAKAANLIISPYLARERTLPVLRFGLAGVPGTAPGLGRMDITDISNNDQLTVIWGQAAMGANQLASTTDKFYEAEALTPVNGAASVTDATASGGHVIYISSLPQGSWVSFLTTEISASSLQLTHTGNYRVWARCFCSTGNPQIRLQWGVGSLSVVTPNPAQTLVAAGTDTWQLVDLGVVQLAPAAAGPSQWFGVLQAYSAPGGENISVDYIFLQPLDAGAGVMSAISVSANPAQIYSQMTAGTGVDVAGVGTVAWSNPTYVALQTTGAFFTAPANSVTTSNYLMATQFGFNVPSTATILGIQVNVRRSSAAFGFGGSITTRDNVVYLVKAGAIQTTGANRAKTDAWPGGSFVTTAYGGATDLWSNTWTPAQVNATNFGVAISATNSNASVNADSNSKINLIYILVYYVLATGFSVTPDAALYAGQTTEVSSRYAWRSTSSGVWGPVGSYVGRYMVVPTATQSDGMTMVVVKESRALIGGLDAGIDDLQAQVSITPRYAQVPNQ